MLCNALLICSVVYFKISVKIREKILNYDFQVAISVLTGKLIGEISACDFLINKNSVLNSSPILSSSQH